MSTLSKYVINPLKEILKGNTSATGKLDQAQALIDSVTTDLVKQGVASVLALVPTGGHMDNLAVDILDDVIAGLQDARTKYLASNPSAASS